MGHECLQLQAQNLPGIWISELGMMAWMPPGALGLRKLYMHCRCTHMHAHTELVLSGTRRVGGTVCSFLQSTSLQRLLSQGRHSPGRKWLWNSPQPGALNLGTAKYKEQASPFSAHTRAETAS